MSVVRCQAGVGGPQAPPADAVGARAGERLVAGAAVLGARPVPPAAAAVARGGAVPAPVGAI